MLIYLNKINESGWEFVYKKLKVKKNRRMASIGYLQHMLLKSKEENCLEIHIFHYHGHCLYLF